MFRRNMTFGLYSVSPYIGYSTIHFWLPFCFFFSFFNFPHKQKYIRAARVENPLTSFSYSVSSFILDDAVASVSLQSRVGTKWRKRSRTTISLLSRRSLRLYLQDLCVAEGDPILSCSHKNLVMTSMASYCAIFSKNVRFSSSYLQRIICRN